MDRKGGCLVCGNELVYSEFAGPPECFYCGNVYDTNTTCIHHHYICDACQSASANDVIERYCIHTSSTELQSLCEFSVLNKECH